MTSIIISIISLIVSITGVGIAVKSWHKNRAFYDIENHMYSAGIALDQLKEKLSTGKYTVISTYNDEFKNIRVLIGKIKK
jgi:hypothetical protein